LQTVPITRLAVLPPAFTADSAFATEYALAWAVLPPDEDDKNEAYKIFAQDVLNRTLNLNIEFT
jgi:staphylococcal nuclease domain-containing protein 1